MARTTTVPFETPARLVNGSHYRPTPNPMYGGLSLDYLGVAGMQLQIWPVLPLPALQVACIERVVIPVAEARLRETFGEVSERNCASVRRWI